jgi:hypothetical protein
MFPDPGMFALMGVGCIAMFCVACMIIHELIGVPIDDDR